MYLVIYMKKLNVTIVYDKDEKHILMCYRKKNPYKDLYNLIGGKVEENEADLKAAYRELEEETGITNKDIILSHVMTFIYPLNDIELQTYAGILNKDVKLIEEKNPLKWIPITDQLTFVNAFGDGNCWTFLLEAIRVLNIKGV